MSSSRHTSCADHERSTGRTSPPPPNVSRSAIAAILEKIDKNGGALSCLPKAFLATVKIQPEPRKPELPSDWDQLLCPFCRQFLGPVIEALPSFASHYIHCKALAHPRAPRLTYGSSDVVKAINDVLKRSERIVAKYEEDAKKWEKAHLSWGLAVAARCEKWCDEQDVKREKETLRREEEVRKAAMETRARANEERRPASSQNGGRGIGSGARDDRERRPERGYPRGQEESWQKSSQRNRSW